MEGSLIASIDKDNIFHLLCETCAQMVPVIEENIIQGELGGDVDAGV